MQTPHLDQLAYEGIRFENAYVDCPVCIPARTALITGRQAHQNGMPSYNPAHRVQRDRAKFLGSLITQAGYQTHLIGKTHWHTDPSFRAGFEAVVHLEKLRKEQFLFNRNGADPTGIGANELITSLSQLPPRLQSTNWIVDQCLEFLETREREQPFFLWASFRDPHPPLVTYEPYFSMYDQDEIPLPVMSAWSEGESCPYAHYVRRWSTNSGPFSAVAIRKARSVYYGMISNLDHQLGRLFGKLMHDGDWENTLVIYSSDHGEFLGDHGAAHKVSFCECSARIPFIVRPHQSIATEPGRISNALVQWTDILPTLCHFAGTEAPADVTGQSLDGILTGHADLVRPTLHGQIGLQHMFHDGHYKYLYDANDGSELLFDVTTDRSDLYPIEGESLRIMREQLIAHLIEERHGHIAEGRLLNLDRPKPPLAEVRARNPSGLGAQAAIDWDFRWKSVRY